MNEKKGLYHVAMLDKEATMVMLNCTLLWFSQQTEKLLHLGYFHLWTLRHLLSLLDLQTQKNTQTDARTLKKSLDLILTR